MFRRYFAEIFFKMISLFAIFVCEVRKQLLSCLHRTYKKHLLVLCGQSASRQLATSSENLVANLQKNILFEATENNFLDIPKLDVPDTIC